MGNTTLDSITSIKDRFVDHGLDRSAAMRREVGVDRSQEIVLNKSSYRSHEIVGKLIYYSSIVPLFTEVILSSIIEL